MRADAGAAIILVSADSVFRRSDALNEIAAWVGKTMQDLQLSEAPLTVEVALAISSIHFPHGDPADHFLAATAKTFDLTVVTADGQFTNLPGIHVLPNR